MQIRRHCFIYKAADEKWYLEIAYRENGGREEANTFGPFPSSEDTMAHLSLRFADPGGYVIDPSGSAPTPTQSPNGGKIQQPTRRGVVGRFY